MPTPNPDVLTELESNHPADALAADLPQMWERGWQPRDIAQLIGADNPVALALFIDQLIIDRQRWHPQADIVWREHADHLGANQQPWWDSAQPFWPQFVARNRCTPEDARHAIAFNELVCNRRFDLPVFAPLPYGRGAAGSATRADEDVLARVRSLLAKAESTSFEHEADAFSAKAQQLITRHAIDVAHLARDIDIPGGRRVYLDSPYTKPKFVLLSAVGQANNCRCVWNKARSTATLIGYRHDIASSEVLFTSLLLQGTAEVIGSASAAARATNRTRSWRNAFWYGFAYRVGERLQAAARTTRSESLASHPARDQLLPVLAAREHAVDAAFNDAFGDIGTLDISVSNADGLHAGRTFADRAELSTDHGVHTHRPSQLER